MWWFALGLVRPANGRGLPFYSLGLTAEPWHWIARGVSPWYALAKHTSNGGAVALALCCDVALGLPWSICWCALGLVRPANGRGLPFYIRGYTSYRCRVKFFCNRESPINRGILVLENRPFSLTHSACRLEWPGNLFDLWHASFTDRCFA